MTAWQVLVSWVALPDRGHGSWAEPEYSEEHPDWPAARHAGRHWTCLAGVRYVSVLDPDSVVVGEYDRYTNRWREYRPPTSTEVTR